MYRQQSRPVSTASTPPFSRQGLIEQLEFEGFTSQQAVYGADHS